MSVMQATSTRRAGSAAVALALVAFGPAACAAQQPSAAAMATAKELVDAHRRDRAVQPADRRRGRAGETSLPAAEPDARQGSQRNRRQDARRICSRASASCIDEVARLYATHFTEQELKDIACVLQVAAGKKCSSEQPKVVDASMKFAQDWANKLSDEVIGEDARRNEEARATTL